MESEIIVYKGREYKRYPKQPKRHLRVYYWGRPNKGDRQATSLHRQIWIDNFGKIPKGFVIHHKDDDPLNNKLSNLQCMEKSEHSRMHSSRPEVIKHALRNLAKARKGAKLWHISTEAQQWKSKRNSKGQFIKK